ncbi:MAG: hypothetical protein IJJ33_15985, partial [Victivallales bacterium]|nr:hypothetical protein [Victivallales bacterium]
MAFLDLTTLIPNTIDRLVAVEPGFSGKAVLYRRLADSTVAREEAVFHPWLLTSSPQLAEALTAPHETIPLTGEGHYRARVVFEDYNGYSAALKELKSLTGVTPSSYHSPYRVFSDFTQQFLSLNSARLFGGMTFNELRRLQLDIETHTGEGRHFPDATQPEDVITLIGLRDSTGWETCLT